MRGNLIFCRARITEVVMPTRKRVPRGAASGPEALTPAHDPTELRWEELGIEAHRDGAQRLG